MRWLRKKWIVVVALLIGLMITPIVSSYNVSPAKWEVYMYKDYEITPQTKLSLIIDNTHNKSISIRFSVYSNPATTNASYKPLPNEDFHWIQFKETDVTIPPHTKYSIPVIVDVPNETANYNKSWQFYIKCDQYAGGDSNGTATFQYDYNLKWTIKTPPRYVPPSERIATTKTGGIPWLYAGFGLIGLTIAAMGVTIRQKRQKRRKTSKRARKHGKHEEDIFK